MKLFALLVALIALGGSVYTMMFTFKEYEDANRTWMAMDREDPNFYLASETLSDLRNQSQLQVMASGAVAFLGLIFGFIAQRKKGGFLPILSILMSLGAGGPIGYMLAEGIF